MGLFWQIWILTFLNSDFADGVPLVRRPAREGLCLTPEPRGNGATLVNVSCKRQGPALKDGPGG